MSSGASRPNVRRGRWPPTHWIGPRSLPHCATWVQSDAGGHLRTEEAEGLAGHGQDGRRFAVVVQTTRMEHLTTWVVVPTSSSAHARRGLTRPEIDWGNGPAVALCD